MRRRMVLALAPLLLGVGGCGYNQIQQKDEQAAQAKQQISVQLQRRADLVPNLVNTVQGAANFEKSTLTEVTNARASVGRAALSRGCCGRDDPGAATSRTWSHARRRLRTRRSA